MNRKYEYRGYAISVSPLRLGDNYGTGFASEADALIAGCTAGKRIVDDLFAASASIGAA